MIFKTYKRKRDGVNCICPDDRHYAGLMSFARFRTMSTPNAPDMKTQFLDRETSIFKLPNATSAWRTGLLLCTLFAEEEKPKEEWAYDPMAETLPTPPRRQRHIRKARKEILAPKYVKCTLLLTDDGYLIPCGYRVERSFCHDLSLFEVMYNPSEHHEQILTDAIFVKGEYVRNRPWSWRADVAVSDTHIEMFMDEIRVSAIEPIEQLSIFTLPSTPDDCWLLRGATSQHITNIEKLKEGLLMSTVDAIFTQADPCNFDYTSSSVTDAANVPAMRMSTDATTCDGRT